MENRQNFYFEQLDNGLIVLGELMDWVSSAAFSILVPFGSAHDPQGLEGSTTVLTEMFNKGAGPWNSREFSDQCDRIGLQRSHSPGVEASIFSGSILSDNLLQALEIYSNVLLDARLPEEELASVKELALQDLKAVEDEPARKTMNELARFFYPYPFSNSQLGCNEGLKAVSVQNLKQFYRQYCLAQGAIIAVAGRFNWNDVLEKIRKCFARWSGSLRLLPAAQFCEADRTKHIQQETSQVQIAIAYPSISLGHPDYYPLRVAIGVLSGGMAGRLFVEVREKRGLVYRIGASLSSSRNRAAVFVHAGTTPEHAEDTLQLTLQEMNRIADGATDDELKMAKADLKSRLIMQNELSSIRAASLANDWWNLGRIRGLEEIKQRIEQVSSADIINCFHANPLKPLTLLTLGPRPLEL